MPAGRERGVPQAGSARADSALRHVQGGLSPSKPGRRQPRRGADAAAGPARPGPLRHDCRAPARRRKRIPQCAIGYTPQSIAASTSVGPEAGEAIASHDVRIHVTTRGERACLLPPTGAQGHGGGVPAGRRDGAQVQRGGIRPVRVGGRGSPCK